MKKRFLAIMLVVTMLLSVCPVTSASAAVDPAIIVDSVVTNPGCEAEIVIRLENNPGITSMKLKVAFAEELELTDVTYNVDLGSNVMPPEDLNKVNENHWVILNWFDAVNDISGDFWYAKLTFAVPAGKDFRDYAIEISYDPNDLFNLAEQNVFFAVENGKITTVCPHTDLEAVEANDPDCTNAGNYAYYICDCGVVLKADGVTQTTVSAETIAATGHSYKSVVTAPTCTEKGYTTHTCVSCNDSYVDTYVNAKGHSYGAWYETKAPGCTTTGTQRRDCTGCDHYETQTVAATGHSYKSVVTAPTCTEKGYTTHTCANCNDSYVDTYTAALGHDWDAGVITTPATCEKDGEKTYTCKHDASHTYTETIPATGHDWDAGTYHGATCDTDAYTEYACGGCGQIRKEVEEGSALGHSYDESGKCVHCGGKKYLLGDINDDGEVDIFDANLAAAYFNEIIMLDDVQQAAGDVNGDNQVDIFDANLIAAYFNEVIMKFPAEG